MNRDEVLKAVTNEKSYDERDKSLLIKGLSISSLIVEIICVLCIIIQTIDGIFWGEHANIAPFILLFFLQFSIVEFFQFKSSKKKKHILLFIIYILITLISFSIFSGI